METRRHCAYDVTRSVLLSERVWCVDGTLGQAELLTLVMNGPGLDRHSGVWAMRVPGWIDLPRLFVLDFAYLDERNTIVEAGSAGPGVGFPPLSEGVVGALILANRRLTETGAVAGDQVRICEQKELPALVKAASQSGMDFGEGLAHPETGYSALSTPFQVSRYSEFIFEPFAGSLVYLPQPEAPTPQSSEFFLPGTKQMPVEPAPPAEAIDAIGKELPASPVKSAAEASVKTAGKPQRRTRKKAAAPKEKPRVHTPEPVRFFDQASAVEKQDQPTPAGEAPETETQLAQSTQPSLELKAAIVQIDEYLRGDKEKRKDGGRKTPPKPRQRKPQKRELPVEEQTPEAVPAAQEPATQEEPAPRPEPAIAAEPGVVEAEPVIAAEKVEAKPEIVAQAAEENAAPVHAEPEPFAPIAAAYAPEAKPRIVAKATLRPPLVQEPIPDVPHEVAKSAQSPVEQPKHHKEKLSVGEWLHRWMGGEASLTGNRRRGDRFSSPGLVAFYWSGGAPHPHEIVNISKSGFYLRTKEIWLPDTLVRMTLQRPHANEGDKESISVLARVVRIDPDGVAHEFVTTDALHHVRSRDILPQHGTNRKELEKFLGMH